MPFTAILRKIPRVTTLAGTLTIALVLLSVFSLVVASSFQSILNVRSQQAVVAAQLQITSLQTAEKVVALITETINILKAASVVGRPFEGSRVKRELFLQSLLKLHSSFQDVTLLDSEGQELQKISRWKVVSPDTFINLADSDLFQQIWQQQNYVGVFHIDPDTHEPLITIAVPILDTFGKFEGGLVADVNIRPVWEVVADLKIGEAGQVYVIDRAGKLLAYKDIGRVLAREDVSQLAHVAEFVRHSDKEETDTVSRVRGITGMAVVATVVPLKNPDWAVVVELPVWEAYRVVLWSVIFSASATFIVALVSSVIGVYLARRLSRPLRHLTETASRIAGGELDQPIDIRGHGEIGMLAWSFAKMRDAIRARIAALHDEIAERRRVEEALRENEEFLHNIVENIPNMIFVKDAEQLRFVRLNKAGETLLGYSEQELLGKSVHDFFPKYEADFFTQHDREVLEQRILRDIPEETVQTRNHGERILHTKKIPILDKTGKPTHLLGISEDITDRKHAEEALRKSEERFRSLVETTSDWVWETNPSGVYTYVSPKVRELLGYKPEEVIGRTPFDLMSPEEAQRIGALFQDIVTNQRPIERLENTVYHKDGRPVVLETNAEPFFDVDGRLLGYRGIDRDITERKRIEEALEKRLVALTRPLETAEGIEFEDLFNLAEIQHLQDLYARAFGVAALITRPDGTPITQPSNFTELCSEIIRNTSKGVANCNYSDAMIGKYNPSGPNIRSCLSAGLCNAGASISIGGRHIANWLIGQVRNETQDEEEIMQYAREIGADETAFRAAYRKVPIMSQEQFERVAQVLFVLANQLSTSAYQNVQQARFIAERKRAEQALQSKTEELDRYFTSSLDLLCIADTDGYFRRLNPEWETTLGYTIAELEGRQFLELVHPEDVDATVAALSQLTAQNQILNFENRYRCKDGSYRWIEWRSYPIGKTIYAVARDITERKQIEETIRTLNAELEQRVHERTAKLEAANKELQSFAYVVSHDLKSPLRAINRLVNWLVEDYEGGG